MNRPPPPRWSAIAVTVAVGLATFAALLVSGGHPGAVLAPAGAVALLYAVYRLPIRTVLVSVVFLVLVAESPQEKPADGLWRSPLYWLGKLLLDNLNHGFGLKGLSFATIDLVCGILILRTLFQRVDAWTPRPPWGHAVSRAMIGALLFWTGTLAVLELWGALRGGSLDASLWQLRQIVYVPLFGFLLAEQLQKPRDYELIARFVIASAVVKAVNGFYFYFAMVAPGGLNPEYITTHADAMHFVAALVIVTARWLEAPTMRNLYGLLLVGPPLAMGIFLNDRRIAYVGIVGCAAILYLLNRQAPSRRWLVRVGLLFVPLLGLYLSAGWNSNLRMFRPVQSIKTMAESKNDDSTASRDIENYNLARTLRERPVFGFGFGHAYTEVVRGPSIEGKFALYRYIPHNSVLWMLSTGGLVGFLALWSVFVVGAYLAARAFFHATAPADRAAALSCLCTVLLYVVQAFGDMGTQSWSPNLMLAAAFVIAGQVAIRVGAWPAPRFVASPALTEKA